MFKTRTEVVVTSEDNSDAHFGSHVLRNYKILCKSSLCPGLCAQVSLSRRRWSRGRGSGEGGGVREGTLSCKLVYCRVEHHVWQELLMNFELYIFFF